ncbi:MAG: tripartite tricarboxylate transporter TctB family protein [Desulforhopalus sp.]
MSKTASSQTAKPSKPSKPKIDLRQPGDSLFAIAMVTLAVFLISQIGSQTIWIEGVRFIVQPRFWPGLSLIFMLIFSVGYLIQSIRDVGEDSSKTLNDKIWQPEEFFNWMRTFEYAAYFLIYVTIIPWLGYLPSTLFFCLFLTIRVGYRSMKFMGWSLVGGFLIVLIFKAFLQVRLPAGTLYDLLPGVIGKIMIRYF